MGRFYFSIEGGRPSPPPKFPSSRGLGQDLVKDGAVKPAPAEERNAQHLSSQTVCKQRVPGTAHSKILQRQEETINPRG